MKLHFRITSFCKDVAVLTLLCIREELQLSSMRCSGGQNSNEQLHAPSFCWDVNP